MINKLIDTVISNHGSILNLGLSTYGPNILGNMCRSGTAENYGTHVPNPLKPEEEEVRRLYVDETNTFCEHLSNLGRILQNPESLLDYVLAMCCGALFSSFTFYHLKKFRLSMNNTRRFGGDFRLNRPMRALGYASTSVIIGLLGTLLKVSAPGEKPKVRVIRRPVTLSSDVRANKAEPTKNPFNTKNYALYNPTTIPYSESRDAINLGKLRRV
jgi:hypothetical protein